MPDNKNIKGPLDKKLIDINDLQEVRNWCKALNCSETQLKQAVKSVGISAEKVREYLKNA